MPLSVELEKMWLILCQKFACGAKSDQNPENTSKFRPNLVKFHEPKYQQKVYHFDLVCVETPPVCGKVWRKTKQKNETLHALAKK